MKFIIFSLVAFFRFKPFFAFNQPITFSHPFKFNSQKMKTLNSKKSTILPNPNLTESEEIVMEELFKNWVDELLGSRVVKIQLHEYFFTATFSSDELKILLDDLENTIGKILNKENLEILPIVTETIKGMKLMINHHPIYNYRDLALHLQKEKKRYQGITEEISKEVCMDKLLNKIYENTIIYPPKINSIKPNNRKNEEVDPEVSSSK